MSKMTKQANGNEFRATISKRVILLAVTDMETNPYFFL